MSIVFFSVLISAQSLYYNGHIGLIRDSTWSANLTGWRHSSLVLGDINNDGYYDMVAMGCLAGGVDTCTTADKIRVYINNGTTFNENLTWEANTTNLGYGSLALGDINNDGKLDLVVLGDKGGGVGDVIIYINNGTTFNENLTWESNLSNVDAFAGSLALGDINNDGKLDLALVGAYPSTDNGIYINNGTSFVKDSNWLSSLPYAGHSLGMGALTFGDYDNDGKLDLIFLGSHGGDFYRSFYTNNGTSLINSTILWKGNMLNEWAWPSLSFGDYDNDGKLDLIAMGTGGGGGDKLYLFNNTGNNFTYQQIISSFFDGSVAWGDYDNNGYLDLAAMGKEEGHNIIVNNNNTFFQYDNIARADMETDDMQQGSLAWIDVNNDTALDLVCNGYSYGDGYLAKVYISNASLTRNNTKPISPNASFSTSYVNNVLNLSWGAGWDNETNTTGLYYNLMVGNATANNTIVSGVYGGSSNPTAGYFGNMMQRRNISLTLELNPDETYKWYVQTIDTGLAKSDWSAVQTFTTSSDVTKPEITLNSPSPNASIHTSNPYFIFNASVIDANLVNVSLYGNWTGSLKINQTNTSALSFNYTFYANLTNYADGMYLWYIEAYDNSNNSQTSGTRDFYLDRTYPIVRLISPENSQSWTSSSVVVFEYNVSDVDIANCSLIINGAVDQTDDSISEDTTQNFIKTLSNGDYTWRTNCTDYVGYTNSSSLYSLTVNYTAPTTSSGGGGGGGSPTFWASTTVLTNEQITNGFTEEMPAKAQFKFNIGSEQHSLGVISLTSNTATVNVSSVPQQATLFVGESRLFEINNDNFYDVYVRLNNIANTRANLTVKSIHEEIPVVKEVISTTNQSSEKQTDLSKTISAVKSSKYSIVFIIIIVLAVIYVIARIIRNSRWLMLKTQEDKRVLMKI